MIISNRKRKRFRKQIPSRLQGWWRFREGAGNVAKDLSKFRNGSISGAVYVTDEGNYALSFDGIDDFVNVDAVNALGTGLRFGFTISCFIKPSSQGEANTGRIVDMSNNATGGGGYAVSCFSLSSNQLTSIVNGGALAQSAAGSIVYDGSTWYSLIITFLADGTITTYIDGVVSGTPVMSGALTGLTNGLDTRIGNLTGGTAATFDGLIKDVRIYNQVLSSSQINLLSRSY